jgi:hypothetical protein
MNYNIDDITSELVPYFRRAVIGKYAIALAGAHAKGKADEHSDVDFFLLAEDMQPHETILEIFAEAADGCSAVSSWDGGIELTYKGIKIETTVRILRQLQEVVEDCRRGKIKIDQEFWTLNGYYNYVHLAEIGFVQPLDDPYNILADLKQGLGEYPPALKKAIIDEFWWKCTFWPNNFHYISAINRRDIVYTSGILHNTFHSMVQLLFALNEKYFSGDKKIELQLSHLEYCPKSLLDNIGLVMTTERDVGFLQKQREVLNAINSDISEKLKESANKAGACMEACD